MNARISIITLCTALVAFSPTLFAAEAAADSKSVKLSPGLDDIVKLSKAGVSDSVILAYVQSSGVMYRPKPKDLIAMSQAGVSEIVTTALMQRGSEIREAALNSQQQAQATAQANVQAAATQSTQPTTTYETAPASSGSTVVYIGSPGLSWSPNGVYNGYFYPRYYYPLTYSYYAPGFYLGARYGRARFGGYYGGYRYWR